MPKQTKPRLTLREQVEQARKNRVPKPKPLVETAVEPKPENPKPTVLPSVEKAQPTSILIESDSEEEVSIKKESRDDPKQDPILVESPGKKEEFSVERARSIFRGIRARGPTGNLLSEGSVRKYVNCFKSVYKDLKEEMFDADILEDYLLDERDSDSTRRSCAVAVLLLARNSSVDAATLSSLQMLSDGFCGQCNDKAALKASMVQKQRIQQKYKFIPYKALLECLAGGAEQRGILNDGAWDWKIQQSKLAFILLSANEPLRSDYRNILIADRVQKLSPSSPYYKDGIIHFPEESKVKVQTGGAVTQDVRCHREVIEDFIGRHESQYLFGFYMEAVTFTHLLLDETKAQLGDRLGIRFFRGKYSYDNRKTLRGAHRTIKGMNNNLPSQMDYYVPDDSDDEEGDKENDVEMAEAGGLECAKIVSFSLVE